MISRRSNAQGGSGHAAAPTRTLEPHRMNALRPSLAPAAANARAQLARLMAALEGGLVERRRVLRLALLAALAGEHTLLIGPPGTAKSQLARRLHLAFGDGLYFERLLTRYTVPEELFGPLSIRALEEDRYERQTEGFLPRASIAFIDEVFKANSAILNALLTLLNEREFDNGPRREACPLVSVIGATNAVPEDEVGEAFFDRFLMRLPVAPVSAPAFGRLLELDTEALPVAVAPLREADRQRIVQAAARVVLDDEVKGLLAELRAWLAEARAYVSDRRWVQIARLLKVAAAAEARGTVVLWDLWLLPWCTAADGARQAEVADWLAARIGVREALSPPRLTHLVEAFEAQVEAEHAADDLDYDESGRLQMRVATGEAAVGVKGTGSAMRMAFTRKRRYGETHVGARLREVERTIERIDAYLAELVARRDDLAAYCAQSLWIDDALARRNGENLAATVQAVQSLRQRMLAAGAGFEALPRLPVDPGIAPAPVADGALAG
jgi:MoxR-like ATPase